MEETIKSLPRMNVEFFAKNMKRKVLLLGKVSKMTRHQFSVTDCSDENALVILKKVDRKQFDEVENKLIVGKWVEVIGKICGRSTIEAEFVYPLDDKLFKTFDKENYIQATRIICNEGINACLALEEKYEHHGSINGEVQTLNSIDYDGLFPAESFLEL